MNLTEKLRITMLKLGVTQIRLAKLTDQSQKNLSNKLTRNNFKLSEYQKLVDALGCTLEVNIVLPNGKKV